MKFTFRLAIKNIRRRPFRSVGMALLVLFLSFSFFAGAVMIRGLQNGLESYQNRLGADIIVVPATAASQGTVDDILLQGITGNYYMSGSKYEEITQIEGIESVTKQFFLTSAKASCCSSRLQIIGFDPATDFSVQAWISENTDVTIRDGDIVVGSNVNVPADREITFYGQSYHVAAQLEETGTGLDSAVYANMTTVQQMAESASNLLSTDPFQGVNIQTCASAVLIKVKEGYSVQDVTDDINLHVSKVQASSATGMVSSISKGLGNVSKVIGGLVAVVLVLAVCVLIIVFAMVSNERRKEFAVLRIMGASKGMLFGLMGMETAIVSLAGALIGLALSCMVVVPVADALHSALELPLLLPGAGWMAGAGVLTVAVSVLAGLLVAEGAARRIVGKDTGLLLREDI